MTLGLATRSPTAAMITAQSAAFGIPYNRGKVSGQTRGGEDRCELTEERAGQCIQRYDDENANEDTGEGCPDPGLRFDGGAREGASRWICAEERADTVGDTDGDQLLVGIDFVAIETTEGFAEKISHRLADQ